MQDPFNPQSGYAVPKTEKKYLSFEEGDTEFMPLASPIIGYEYWNTAGKPARSATPFDEVPDDIRIGKDGKPEPIKHFWALPVWDFNERARIRVKVLEITQKSIMKQVIALTKNPKWGSPVLKYSMTVTRDDSGDITQYSVMPNPVGDLPTVITTEWERVQADGFDITRMYTGGDPFINTGKVD